MTRSETVATEEIDGAKGQPHQPEHEPPRDHGRKLVIGAGRNRDGVSLASAAITGARSARRPDAGGPMQQFIDETLSKPGPLLSKPPGIVRLRVTGSVVLLSRRRR